MPVNLGLIWRAVSEFTMMDAERVGSLVENTQRVVQAGIPGSITECGVWKGGAMMAVAMTLNMAGCADRDLFLFDTFEGMTRPESVDVDLCGCAALPVFESLRTDQDRSDWCCASLAVARKNVNETGYPQERIYFVAGDVLETLPEQAPDAIALLHLDTDFYRSTRHELVHLYPRVSRGGVIIVDDYGHWRGAKKAVDEYFEEHNPGIEMYRCGYTSAIFVKD